MTANQIAYARLKEEERANQERERETYRSNTERERQSWEIAKQDAKIRSYQAAASVLSAESQATRNYMGAFSDLVKTFSSVGSIFAQNIN